MLSDLWFCRRMRVESRNPNRAHGPLASEDSFFLAKLREEGDAERMADTMLKSEKVNALFSDLSLRLSLSL